MTPPYVTFPLKGVTAIARLDADRAWIAPDEVVAALESQFPASDFSDGIDPHDTAAILQLTAAAARLDGTLIES